MLLILHLKKYGTHRQQLIFWKITYWCELANKMYVTEFKLINLVFVLFMMMINQMESMLLIACLLQYLAAVEQKR